MYDLNLDGGYEILISMVHILWQQTGRFVTKIYKPDSTSIVPGDIIIPESNKLYQNYPNPFNPATNIRFEITQTSLVTLRIFDLLGEEKTILLDKELSPGGYEIDWEGQDSNGKLLPSGVYLIQLNADNYTRVIKALLMR
jgi:hypothetical protein